MKSRELTSGFARFDFLLAFTVADPAARARLVALCEEDWGGTRVGEGTWEISTPLAPDALEQTIAALLGARDQAVYYYLADTKRFFRVVVRG